MLFLELFSINPEKSTEKFYFRLNDENDFKLQFITSLEEDSNTNSVGYAEDNFSRSLTWTYNNERPKVIFKDKNGKAYDISESAGGIFNYPYNSIISDDFLANLLSGLVAYSFLDKNFLLIQK